MNAQLRDQQLISRRKETRKRKTENINLKYYDCTLITECRHVHSIRYYISIKIKPLANSHNIDKITSLNTKNINGSTQEYIKDTLQECIHNKTQEYKQDISQEYMHDTTKEFTQPSFT